MEKKNPEDERELLRQKEIKENPAGNLNDSLNRSQHGSLTEFSNGMSTKTLGIVLLIVIVIMFLGWLIFA